MVEDAVFFEILNDFHFEGISMEDLRQFLVEETDYENPFAFFMELFTYCRHAGFYFQKSTEISLISFVLENLEEIAQDGTIEYLRDNMAGYLSRK